ncbi:wall-associated receptor kinase 5-like [Macadamia integrifolia]|uniref:wall-associated receptor kinase 5-like n=1 Tax=Macadamia integrifolia TaxID=60698 RepID=UPI001C4F12B4|nr:wall-associated receptor kinase 5-like [Macadamia integrifolia]
MVLNNLVMILLSLFSLSVTIAMAVPPPLALPGCDDKCGNVAVPYPFGIKDGCFRDPDFNISCSNSNSSSIKAYQKGGGGGGRNEVLEISLSKAQVIVDGGYSNNTRYCSRSTDEYIIGKYDLNQSSSFTWSSDSNLFTAIGCNIAAYIRYGDFMSACVTLCDSLPLNMTKGACYGIGCCQTTIPKGLKTLNITVGSIGNGSAGNWKFSACNFAFLTDQKLFSYELSNLSAQLYESSFPVVLDWAIGNQTCEEAVHDKKSYACGSNSYCFNSTNGPGYLCNCTDGFEGNPYIGCQDINECEIGDNLCDGRGKCNNMIGSYNCYCPKGYYGDGWKNGTGCTEDPKRIPLIKIIAGVGISFIFVFVCIYFGYCGIQRRRIIKRREKFFQQNGGLLLQQQIASRRGVTDNAGIFTMEELNKATNNFDESGILGQGGYGTVFKGTLSNGKVVAIKKSKIMDKSQIIQFINEVDILSQINHRNVVKLLGCCLEMEVPLLVYEFISNGTLFQHIHNENQAMSLSWGNRLRIAAETAGALGYLHSAHSLPILHRDVKSSNILLNDNYMAKVSDFGASRLAPLDQTQAMTLVQGTLGYLDPECFITGQLTDKSDVYSFGVVLAELLTGKKPILSEGSEECKSLAMHFVSSLKDDNLFQILNYQVLNEGNKEQLVAVAKLARRCLKLNGEYRPTMKEVAMELESLRTLYEHPWIQHNHEETESFLGEPSTRSAVNVTDQESLGDSFALALEIAR